MSAEFLRLDKTLKYIRGVIRALASRSELDAIVEQLAAINQSLSVAGRIEALRLHEGDVVTFTVRGVLPQAAHARLVEQLKQIIPGYKVIILEEDARLGVVRGLDETQTT